jgi:hypothetical protein
MTRGTALDLTLTGTNLAEPTALWTSFPAKVTIPTDNNNGKDPAKLRVHLEVPKEAPLGFHSIRLATARGLSNFRLFCLDDLPQVTEVETNHTKQMAQPVTAPCVVVGRADAEVSDFFRFGVKAGERLSFEVLGRRLGSAFNPQLILYQVAGSGARELPGGQATDTPGLQADARLTYTFKDAGDYLVEVRDVTFRGGPDFWYRLRIGDFPCATAPLPMAAKRGTKATVNFTGPMVEGVTPVEVNVPADPAVNTVWVSPRGANGLSGWPVALAVSDHDELVEQEPNNEPAQANRVPVPGGITGRILEKGDRDHFVFTAKKGQRLIIEAHSLELYSTTEVYMVLKDAKGAQLAATNPVQPPRLDFNPPADGDYTLAVEHLHYDWSGPSEVYRVTVALYEPGFSIALQQDRFDVAQGGVVAIPIILTARRDYPGAIEVSATGHPGLTGTVTIKEGQAPNAAPPPQPPQIAAQLLLNVAPDVPMGAYRIYVQAKATINGKAVVEYASVRTSVSVGLANLTYPPREMLTEVGVGVTEKPPFSLTAKLDLPEALRGVPATMTVTATRMPNFTEEIALTPVGLPPTVPAAVKPIAKGTNEIKITLTPAANAPLGPVSVSFVGKTKFNGKDYSVTSLPASFPVTLPFDLKVEPAPVKVLQGDKVKIKVTAARKGGYQGPIAVELRNLPANVTAPKATIDMGKTEVEIEIDVAAAAAVADKADVNVLGTATAAANQQAPSPNFVLSIGKK